MDLFTCFLLLIIGLFAGGYGVIVGAGGGFIFVPALLILFNMTPQIAAGTGLVIVLLNSLFGTIGYVKQKRIDYKLGLVLTLGAVPGTFLGIQLSRMVSDGLFHVAFAVMLIALGMFLFIKNRPGRTVHGAQFETAAASEPLSRAFPASHKSFIGLLILGLVLGIISNFFGIGGGWLLVPILIYLFKVPPHQATATSLFSLSLYASMGVGLQIFYQHIDWMAVLWGGIGVMLGAQLGVLISNKLPGNVIIQMLSVLLIGVGLNLIVT